MENSNALWVCGADGLIAVSSDGGTTWTQKHLAKNGNLLLAMGFANEQFGYAGGTGSEILLTKDGGNTWDSRKAPADVVYEVAFSDERHGIIHTTHAVYFTGDGAITWASVPIDLASDELKRFSHVLSVVAVDAKQMAIVLSEGNSSVYAYKLFLTKDGGATWPAHDIPSTGLGKLSAHAGEYWFERIMVTRDFQGVAEVRLKLQIGQNGLVERADVLHATNAGIGERVEATVRTWIFLPFAKDGAVHPLSTEINLKVQAIRSK